MTCLLIHVVILCLIALHSCIIDALSLRGLVDVAEVSGEALLCETALSASVQKCGSGNTIQQQNCFDCVTRKCYTPTLTKSCDDLTKCVDYIDC
jgi:hypothetical protein